MLETKKYGVLMIGNKGSIATTVRAAQHLQAKCPDYFRVPTDSLDEVLLRDLNASLKFNHIVFGGWDLSSQSSKDCVGLHGVLTGPEIVALGDALDDTYSYKAQMTEFDCESAALYLRQRVSRGFKDGDGSENFKGVKASKFYEIVRADIESFKASTGVQHGCVLNLASVQRRSGVGSFVSDISTLRSLIAADDVRLPGAIIYALASIDCGFDVINFTPNITSEMPFFHDYALERGVVLSGRDGKTGQTLYKTVLADMFRQRGLRVKGWFSTNILGNSDGMSLSDPHNVASKIDTKSDVLNSILGYDDIDHQVYIHYYRPRGDSKEAWDNIDFDGWFGRSMSMKINWIGEDSILAAPIVVDLIRLVAHLRRKSIFGFNNLTDVFYKAPYGAKSHSFFTQWSGLESGLRKLL